MPTYPPFMNSYGLIPKILEKIKAAKTPERFTQDYLANTLGFKSGSAKSFIPLAKRLGILSSDGAPTDLYQSFRNPNRSKGAMARALKTGYADLFMRNEEAYKLDHRALEGLIVQATGLDKGSTTLRAIISTFENLRSFADFGNSEPLLVHEELPPPASEEEQDEFRIGLSYTINLVLPKTDDVAVYGAIFRAMKENMLRR